MNKVAFKKEDQAYHKKDDNVWVSQNIPWMLEL